MRKRCDPSLIYEMVTHTHTHTYRIGVISLLFKIGLFSRIKDSLDLTETRREASSYPKPN